MLSIIINVSDLCGIRFFQFVKALQIFTKISKNSLLFLNVYITYEALIVSKKIDSLFKSS
jgi:hypothetical protein